FSTASKHSAITSPEGTYNNFYNENNEPNTGDYVINPVPTDYFFEVVTQPSEFKEEVSFSTQLRTILFTNQFQGGVPLDYRKKSPSWDNLSEEQKLKESKIYRQSVEFSDAIENIIAIRSKKILDKLDAVYDKTTDSYTLNNAKFSQFLQEEFDKRNLPLNIKLA